MSAMAKAGRFSARYLLAKWNTARDIVLNEMHAPTQAAADSSVVQMFQDALKRQLTAVIAVTGAAMAPAINAAASSDASAYEKLVVRLLPRPSSRNVAVGDVVAFSSPLDPSNSHSMMVRRVAALEGQTMLSADDEAHHERVPGGHCWVLADNEELQPPDVIDSRVFGYLDMRLIMGRVIYRIRSQQDQAFVTNSLQAAPGDAAVLESEVDVDALADGMPNEQ